MASLPRVHHAFLLFSLCSLSLTCRSFSLTGVHELLPLYNLPEGLLPSNIKSYTLSNTDKTFTIELSAHPCYVKFNDHLVYYDRTIKGKLEYGKVSGLSGIEAKKFLFWVSVDAINVDENNEMIEFYVGSLSQKLPAKDFEIVHSCRAKGLGESFSS